MLFQRKFGNSQKKPRNCPVCQGFDRLSRCHDRGSLGQLLNLFLCHCNPLRVVGQSDELLKVCESLGFLALCLIVKTPVEVGVSGVGCYVNVDYLWPGLVEERKMKALREAAATNLPPCLASKEPPGYNSDAGEIQTQFGDLRFA